MYIFNHYINNRILRILLIALLIFCMVFGAFMVQYSYADLVLVPAIAVCATLLVACGVMSATDTDLQAVATAFHNSLAGQALEDVKAIAMDYGLIGSDKFTFKATKTIVNALADWISTTFDPVNSIINIDGSLSVDNIDFSWCDVYLSTAFYDLEQADKIAVCNNIPPTSLLGTVFPSGYKVNLLDNGYYDVCYFSSNTNSWVSLWETSHFFVKGFCVVLLDDAYYLYFNRYETETAIFGDGWSSFPLSTSTSTVTTFPKTQAETDSTYFPKEVVDAAGGTTTFPSNTASKPLTTETPLTIPQEGVNSTTMPGDVRTDADSPSIDVPLDIPGWLSKIWDGVTAIPDAIVGGVTAIVDAVGDVAGSIADTLSDFFNPSEFKLDFSKFKVGLTEVFPFCIPFDFVKAIKLLATDSSGFSFDIDLKTTWFTIDHTVDLKPFRIPILFFRFICDFWFGYILISRTRDWIKW